MQRTMSMQEIERIRSLAEQCKSRDPTDGNLEGVMAAGCLYLLGTIERMMAGNYCPIHGTLRNAKGNCFHCQYGTEPATTTFPASGELVDDGQDLSDRVALVVKQRDDFRHIASEVIATLTLGRNHESVSDVLRDLAHHVWKPAFDAAINGTELTDEQVEYALAAHSLDVSDAHKRIQAAIEAHKKTVQSA